MQTLRKLGSVLFNLQVAVATLAYVLSDDTGIVVMLTVAGSLTAMLMIIGIVKVSVIGTDSGDNRESIVAVMLTISSLSTILFVLSCITGANVAAGVFFGLIGIVSSILSAALAKRDDPRAEFFVLVLVALPLGIGRFADRLILFCNKKKFA